MSITRTTAPLTLLSLPVISSCIIRFFHRSRGNLSLALIITMSSMAGIFNESYFLLLYVLCSGKLFIYIVVPWCRGYHYCTSSFSETWIQVLRRFKSCSRRVGDWRWWGSLTMVPAGNKTKHILSVNHTTKIIHHHHHH